MRECCQSLLSLRSFGHQQRIVIILDTCSWFATGILLSCTILYYKYPRRRFEFESQSHLILYILRHHSCPPVSPCPPVSSCHPVSPCPPPGGRCWMKTISRSATTSNYFEPEFFTIITREQWGPYFLSLYTVWSLYRYIYENHISNIKGNLFYYIYPVKGFSIFMEDLSIFRREKGNHFCFYLWRGWAV